MIAERFRRAERRRTNLSVELRGPERFCAGETGGQQSERDPRRAERFAGVAADRADLLMQCQGAEYFP